MPRRKKRNATRPPPMKRPSTRSTTATSRSNATNATTSGTADETAPMVNNISNTPHNIPAIATQLPQTQKLLSQLSSVVHLLTTSLSGNAPINNPHPQVATPNDNSAEVLSEASDNPPVNPLPATTIKSHVLRHLLL